MSKKPYDLDAAIDNWITDNGFIRSNNLSALTDSYFASCESPHTRKAYFVALRPFAHLLSRDDLISTPADITTSTIRRYLDGMTGTKKNKLSANTRAQALVAIRRWLEMMAARGLITRNPCDGIRAKTKDSKSGKAASLTPQQLSALFQSIPPLTPLNRRDRALIAFLSFTACRIGAALKLTHAAFRTHPTGPRVLLDEKNDKQHIVPLAPELIEHLAPYLAETLPAKDNEPVFRRWDHATRSFTAEPIPYIDAYTVIKQRLSAAGITGKVSPHSFRRTTITIALANGMPLETAQKLANHARIETTQRYDDRDRDVTSEDLAFFRGALPHG